MNLQDYDDNILIKKTDKFIKTYIKLKVINNEKHFYYNKVPITLVHYKKI